MAKLQQAEIDRLKADLMKKLAWGNVDKWHSSMFSELSQNVFEVTDIKLSPATLKRFFGIIKYDGTPSITTLDALSIYIGFENWRVYKLSKQSKFADLKEGISHKLIYSFIGFFAALVFIIILANRAPSPSKSLPSEVTFSSRTVANSYPNSVIFDFDLKSTNSDSLKIQQYWDRTKTIDIHKDQKQATGIYYFPGYFQAKLLVNKTIVSKHDLFLRSNGWLGTIEYEPVPKYFSPLSDINKKLYYPTELQEEISTSDAPLSIIYHYINDLGNVSGDDFVLKASIRNTYDDKWGVCQSSRIYIIGTDGAMIIPFSKLGCSSNNNLLLNDVYMRGTEHDLSAFGTDLGDFTPIQILNENKMVSISINGKKVFSTSYSETMGKLVGLRFKFLGLGEIESFELVDQNNTTVVF
jgi:hypothetical protein